MKSRYFLLIGFFLLLLTVVVPILILSLGSDPRNPDAAEMQACCAPIPLIVLSLLFITVGITRLINERSNKNLPSITGPDD